MVTIIRRYWTLAVRHGGCFVPEFGSFVRGEIQLEFSLRPRWPSAQIDVISYATG
jgi:hypothetical protein